jgi:mannose-1-phosphate guanylyltransferase/mannose-6-phosphate isomerase
MTFLPYILSGGSGTRLWPLSRAAYPKQFHDLTGSGNPLLIETIERLESLGDVTVVTGEKLERPTRMLLGRMQKQGVNLLIEPMAKDTAAAIALIVKDALAKDEHAICAALPSDHAIQSAEAFKATLQAAARLAEEKHAIVTIGIEPTYPATCYGYIVIDAKSDSHKVKSFIEKPEQKRAEALLEEGNMLWNAGMFVFKASEMAALMEEHMPQIWLPIKQAETEEELLAAFQEIEKTSIDYALMEKLEELYCIPATFDWSDLGSFESILDARGDESQKIDIDGEQNVVIQLNTRKKPTVFVGLDDVICIDTPDAALLVKRGSGQLVKEAVRQVKERFPELIERHAVEERSWGRFEILSTGGGANVRKLILFPGASLPLQRHMNRKESWILTSGEGEFLLDGERREVRPGDSFSAEPGEAHMLRNMSETDMLECIEVQTGEQLSDDDIEHLDEL